MDKYQIPPKIEKAMKTNRRLWRNGGKTLTVAIAFLIFGIIGKSCWDGYWRTHSWEVRSPFQNPLIIREVKPQVLLPVIMGQNTPEGQIKKQNEYPSEWEEAYKLVRLHESSNGRETGLNGLCISQGGLNEIGYDPQEKYCFSDSKEQHETFMLWVKNRLGIPCLKVGYCRANMHDLLLMYTNNGYTL